MSTRLSSARPVAGLTFRTYVGPTEIPVVTDVMRAAHLFDDTELIPSEERIANEFAHGDGYVPTEDVFLGELDGRVVAVGEVRYVRRDDAHTYVVSGAVHPDVRRRGIGRALLAHLEARAGERAATLPDAGPVWLDAWMPDQNVAFGALMQQARYEPIRHFFEMLKGDLGSTVAVDLPAGLELRPVVAADMRRIFDAEEEAFRDHWGRRDWSDELFAELLADPDLDPTLWRVAWDGDEVAGVVTTFIIADENETLGLRRGWLAHVSVRRPWRRRAHPVGLHRPSRARYDRGSPRGRLGQPDRCARTLRAAWLRRAPPRDGLATPPPPSADRSLIPPLGRSPPAREAWSREPA